MNDKKIQKIVATVFIHRDNKLFIARRADTKRFLPGAYELPGGHIEFGETMEEGLVREFKEEFNVDIEIGEPFDVFTYICNNGAQHAVEVCYFAAMIDPDQEIELHPEDHSEYRWITHSEIPKFFTVNDREGEAAKKGFGILSNKKY